MTPEERLFDTILTSWGGSGKGYGDRRASFSFARLLRAGGTASSGVSFLGQEIFLVTAGPRNSGSAWLDALAARLGAIGAAGSFWRKKTGGGDQAPFFDNDGKEERFSMMMDCLPLGVFKCDGDGRLTFANEQWRLMTGQTLEGALGKPCMVSIHPEDQERVNADWELCLRRKAAFRSEHRIVSVKGDVRWVSMKGSFVSDGGDDFYLCALQDISAQRIAEEALMNSAQRSRILYRETPMPYLCMNIADGNILDVNAAWENMTGFSKEEALDRWIGDFMKNEGGVSLQGVPDFIRDIVSENKFTGGTKHYVAMGKNGDERLVTISGGVGYTIQGAPSVLHCIMVDITELRNIENTIRMLDMAVKQSPISILITDIKGNIEYVNPTFTKLSGYALEEVFGRNPRLLKGGGTEDEEYADLWRRITAGETWSGTLRNRKKNGETYWGEALIAPVRDVGGEISHYIGVMQDITARRDAEDRVEFLAHHDALTMLPNRLLGKERMEWAMAHADRSGGKAAIALIDLDHFKRINDSLGHSAGDALLREVAARLKGCVREADVISRQGGDEFLVVLSGAPDSETIARVVAKIMRGMTPSYHVAGREIAITLSIGIAVYPDDGADYDSLLKRADAAMYHAKGEGRNGYRFFTEKMNADANEYLVIATALQKAFERNEFILYYQPQIELSSGRVVGVESLIRWRHPEWGLVAPGRFIPVAEESGMIVPMGDWILREACSQARRWRNDGVQEMVVAVNMSGSQFRRGNVLQSVENALSLSGLEPKFLELELTESILMKDTDNVLQTVEELKALGVQLSIDDFGTGYSSLSYLKKFHVDKVKVDQSFIRDITSDSNDSAIVRAIVQMARELGLRTIAEGVEGMDTLEAVREHQCDEVQGHVYARPMPAKDIPVFLERHATAMREEGWS